MGNFYENIVVKIEYTAISNTNGHIDLRKMERLAMILSNLHNSGKHILLVSSGAIALGTNRLKVSSPPQELIEKQALSAIGQAELIKIYQNCFESYNQIVAQVLLTKDVMENQLRMINAKNTFMKLMEMNIIPVINENDTVSTDDIELNDNYPLTRNVAYLSGATMIIIKSDIDSEYDLLLKGETKTHHIFDEEKLLEKVEELMNSYKENESGSFFPESIKEIELSKYN